jgi:hypothetical protein
MASQMGQVLNQPGQGQAGASAGGPPPLPKGAQYFVALDGKQAGPFGAEALKEQIAAGRLTRDTLVWAEGMAEWTAASDVDAVAKLFGAVPPPIPPA